MFPALALAVALLSHPISVLTLIVGIGIVGMAVTVAGGGPLNFGAFSTSNALALICICGSVLNTFAAGVTAGTIPAGVLTGALTCYLLSASTTPGNQTTRTAAQLYADWCAVLNVPALPLNFGWEITITQTGAGTMTVVGGTGVTTSGTMTIAQNTSRTFVATFTAVGNAPALTLTAVGTGTIS